jgi:putative peptide zinc metalloprotease protein
LEPIYSPSWYRVASLRPRLAAETRFHRHVVRGSTWFVVRNPSTGRVHRLAPAAHALAGLLDGARTVQEAWDALVAQWGDLSPTQDEVIHVLGVLHAAGLLRGDVPADTEVLSRRAEEEERDEKRARRNPVAFRVPLFDPDALLTRLDPWLRPLFSRAGAWLWCAVVVGAGITALRHAPELGAAAGTLFEPGSALALWFAYPVVKALHELGHGCAVKRWGGEVHEVGILFLVFVPVPYVDASAASVFPEKRRRMAVGAAGIAVELFLAAVATFVWVAVEPGPVRHVAYAVMLVGGLSSAFVNGNPLLRFDGYHVLADAIEIPNLAPRANAYLGAVARRWILGVREAALPDTAPGEAPWLLGYAVASFLYGIAILLGIALYLARHFFFIGVALACVTIAARVVWPLLRLASSLLSDPMVGERRGRALTGTLGVAAAAGVLAFGVPVPLHTRSEGIVWLPEQCHVRAGTDGFVVEVLAAVQSEVQAGQPLIRVRDAALEAHVKGLAAERSERRRRALALSLAPDKRVEAEIAREKLADTEAALARAHERSSAVVIRSPAAGIFVPRDGRDLVGSHVREGEVVAYVVDVSAATARVLVPQEDVALLRERTEAAWIRLAHDLGTVIPARVTREVPAITDRLPTAALGTAGGGPFAVDRTDPDGLRTLERYFQLELALPDGVFRVPGERVHVRFDHGAEPMGPRVWRAVRRVFLSQLGV